MVTWILSEEPSDDVALAIELIESRIGSDAEINWLAPGPVIEPIQD